MISLSEVRFQFHGEGVDWQELVALFKRTNLGGREGDKVRRAFERSSLVCFATDGSRLEERRVILNTTPRSTMSQSTPTISTVVLEAGSYANCFRVFPYGVCC
jgi:hypothetical protein